MIENLKLFAAMENIAENLTPEELNKIGTDVVTGFNTDVNSRAEWEERSRDHMKLAMQISEMKTTPWEKASNVKYPIITEAALQFSSRAYPALVTGADIVKARVAGEDHSGEKSQAAIRVGKHMSYQLLEEMDDWEADQDLLLLSISILGSMFKKVYYDPIEGVNRSELIFPKDFVVDYYTKNIRKCYRATHVLYLRANDIKIAQVNGLYLDVALGDPEAYTDTAREELSGDTAPPQDSSTTRRVLEQHTYLDLDKDGIEEPYIITVDLTSSKVLRIYACYDPEMIKVDDEGNILFIPKMTYFVRYLMMASPDGGVYGMGFGTLLSPINNTVDTTINMLIDAGHMSTLQAGFLSRSVRIKSGNNSFKPGEWKVLNSSAEDLHKGIVPLPTREPSGVLFNLLGMMVNSGQRLASTIDSMVGENPGQNQKATTTLAVLEQGSKIFNAIHKRMYRSFKEELQLLFLLNSKYLEGERYFDFIDPNVELSEFMSVSAQDYDSALMNIIPTADPNAGTMQIKMAKANALLELLGIGLLEEREVLARVLEAQEQPAIERLFKGEQPPPQPDFDQQIEIEKNKTDAYFRNKEFLLAIIKLEQSDLTTQANVILTLAKAEAEEKGPQLELYKTKMQALAKQSQTLGDRARALAPSFEPEQPQELPPEEGQPQEPPPAEQDYTGAFTEGTAE